MSWKHMIGAGLLAVVAVACIDERPSWLEEPLEVEGPMAVNGRFVYLHRTFDELLVITPEFQGNRITHTTERVELGRRPLEAVVSDDGELLLTINAGDQTVTMVELDSLQTQTFDLPSDYDALTVSPDARFVVAHFRDAASGGAGDAVFRNQNEITIFDLDPEGSGDRLDEVQQQVLSLRSSPLGFDFLPPFSVAGASYSLLVVRGTSALTLIDPTADNPVDLQRRLFFVPEESTRQLIPTRVLYTVDDPEDDFDMRLFVLTTNAQDIFEVAILPPGPEDETALALSLNQFPAGAQPIEMIDFLDTQGQQKLLVVNPSRLVVVDVATGNTVEVPIQWSVSQALAYGLTDEESGLEEAWALLFSPNLQTVVFVNLDQLESRGSRAVTPLTLSRGVQSVGIVSRPGASKAVVVHSGATALSVIDLERRFDIPLPGSATLRNIAFSPDGGRIFTTVAEVAVLAEIELENGHPSQVDLPDPGGRLAVTSDPQVVLVDHGAEEGRMTLLNAVDLSAPQHPIDGLFLETLLSEAGVDREED